MKYLILLFFLFLSCDESGVGTISQIDPLEAEEEGKYGGYVSECLQVVEEVNRVLEYTITCSKIYRRDDRTELKTVLNTWIEENCPQELEILNPKRYVDHYVERYSNKPERTITKNEEIIIDDDECVAVPDRKYGQTKKEFN